jgi:putative radical SAM enzyme (TIGR03279 family)
MRLTLYFKDDDYRLSFLFGNYITLNDIKRRDIRRIKDYGLSPLFVSVHATDGKVRERIFGRPMKSGIMDVLTELAESGITIHAQVVVLPGVNDGRILRRTARDLFTLYPAVASLAVVPVGLTGHRTGLTRLENIDPAQARIILDSGKSLNASFAGKTGGSNFVFMSDEFYLLAGRNFPDASFYGAFEQLSNGVGMCRLFIDSIEERLKILKSRKVLPSGSMTVVTGRLGSRLMRRYIIPRVERELPGLEVRLVTADNGTFGRSVTVSGLLAGRDIEAAVSKSGIENGVLVLPPNTVNHEGRLLDDIRPSFLGKKLGLKVMVPKEDFLENRILREAGRTRS